MAIDKVGGVSPVAESLGQESGKPSFARALGDVKGEGRAASSKSRPIEKTGASEGPRRPNATRPGARAGSATDVKAASSARERTAVRMAEQVHAAQQRLDHVLRLAESGKTFSPAELLALQAQVYRASQELDLAGKVVEKATSGVKQVLQTQV